MNFHYKMLPQTVSQNTNAVQENGKPVFSNHEASCVLSYTQNFVASNAPVILSRFGRYVVPTLLTPTFRRNWCWFRLCATLCHDELRCCHAVATPGPRYCPVSTRLTSDTGKFSYVVLRYVTLPPRCSLAVATLSYAMPRNMMKHSVSQRVKNVA